MPLITLKRWLPNSRAQVSSTTETSPLARKSTRNKLNKKASNVRPDDGPPGGGGGGSERMGGDGVATGGGAVGSAGGPDGSLCTWQGFAENSGK